MKKILRITFYDLRDSWHVIPNTIYKLMLQCDSGLCHS